jgi:serine/threonine protein kinase
MRLTTEQFLRQLRELQLVPVSVLSSRFPPSLVPEEIGEILIRDEHLTRFQVDRLLEGKGHRLVLGEYVIEKLLDRGGIGRVYRARHRLMGRKVAIKVLSKEILTRPEIRVRFQSEIQLGGKLIHPNLVMSFDAGERDGEPYLVMEFVPGPNLKQLVNQQGPLEPHRAVALLIQIARGLEYAHGKGIIHRDIKPANLIVDPEGTVKILDLGLAHRLSLRGSSPGDGLLTDTKRGGREPIAGTPDFMPPEQSREGDHFDERSDIYSLGCTLFYLLTGRVMFEADSFAEKLHAHRSKPAPGLGEFRQDLPPGIEAIYRRMTAKSKEERYLSAGALREDLERLDESDAATWIQFAPAEPHSARDRERGRAVRRAFSWRDASVLVGVLAVIVILIGINWPARDAGQLGPPSPEANSDQRANPFANSPPEAPPPEEAPPQNDPADDPRFALEFLGDSQVVLPAPELEPDHVLIVELVATPLPTGEQAPRVLLSQGDPEEGWALRLREDDWSLCVFRENFPLVQLNSREPIRWGEPSAIRLVVHPEYVGWSLAGESQAEWEGPGHPLGLAAPLRVGQGDSGLGFVGKIQSLDLARVDQLLIDERERRLLPRQRTPLAAYRFTEGAGPLLVDQSGALRHGTIEGAVWSYSD